MTVRFVPATREHVEYVLDNLSAANRREATPFGMTPKDALLRTWAHSEETWTIELDGEAVGLYGLCPTREPGCGCPWMVGTERLPLAGVAVVKHGRPVIAGWLRRYPRLSNLVDDRNYRLMRWLKWLGFAIDAPQSVGPDGTLFHRYHMEAPWHRK